MGPRTSDGKRSVANPTKTIEMKIEKVELHQSENAWKPGMMVETPNGEIQVKFLGIFVTFEHFSTLLTFLLFLTFPLF
jgi:hypothetical protein